MCQNSFDPSELESNVGLPSGQLHPHTYKADADDDDDMEDAGKLAAAVINWEVHAP